MPTMISRSWKRLHEPRSISALYGIWWTLCIILGGISVINPPGTIEAVAGDVLMVLMASAVTIGGITGVITVARGAWWAERTAVWAVTSGVIGYILMVSYLWTVGGNRGFQLLMLIGALILTLLRFYWVWDRPYSKERRTHRRIAD